MGAGGWVGIRRRIDAQGGRPGGIGGGARRLSAVRRSPPGAGDGGAVRHARLVDAFDRATVHRITISRAGAAPFSLVRQPPGKEPSWRESPGGEAADAAAVEDLLNAIDLAETTHDGRRARRRRVDAAPGGPRARRAARPRQIDLGRLDAAGQGVFARVGGATTIGVAPRRVADLADRDASAFRDRRLVPLSADAITAISWRGPAPPAGGPKEHQLRLVAGRWQNADNQWVAGERVAESLRRLLGLRVERYEPPRPAPEAPSWIEVATTGGARIHLSIPGDRCAAEAGVRVERDGPSGAPVPAWRRRRSSSCGPRWSQRRCPIGDFSPPPPIR